MYKLYMVRMFIHVFCLLLQQHNENLESFLFSSLCSFLIRKDGISLTYATLNSQLKKSSCYKCWRMVSKVWKCIQYATLWIEECCCLVKDSTDERRQKSVALFFSLLSWFLYLSFFCFLLLSSLYFFMLPLLHSSCLYAICGKGMISAFQFFSSSSFLSLPFLFLLQIVSSHLPLLISAPTRVCGDWCSTSLEVFTVTAAASVFAACGTDWLSGFFSHLFYNSDLYLFEHNIILLLFCSSYQCSHKA